MTDSPFDRLAPARSACLARTHSTAFRTERGKVRRDRHGLRPRFSRRRAEPRVTLRPSPRPACPRRMVAVVVAAAGSVALSGGPALASTVSCGSTITATTKLHADLANCPGDGLVIDADNVTIDLNGHTI